MAPADDGGRELGADLQVDEAAAAGEAQRPPLHLPAQVNSNQTNNTCGDTFLILPCLKQETF